MPRFVHFCLVLLLLLPSCGGENPPDPAELLKRAKAAHLEWDSYQEDIKGQIGATPAALWDGEPTSIFVRGDQIEVTFTMKPPWDAYPVAMPILLRGPLGKVYTNRDFKLDGTNHTCIFSLPDLAEIGSLPWVEIHYPHTERRFSLQNGQWEKE